MLYEKCFSCGCITKKPPHIRPTIVVKCKHRFMENQCLHRMPRTFRAVDISASLLQLRASTITDRQAASVSRYTSSKPSKPRVLLYSQQLAGVNRYERHLATGAEEQTNMENDRSRPRDFWEMEQRRCAGGVRCGWNPHRRTPGRPRNGHPRRRPTDIRMYSLVATSWLYCLS